VSGNPIKIRRVLHYVTDWTSVEDTLLSAVQGVESPSPDPRVGYKVHRQLYSFHALHVTYFSILIVRVSMAQYK